MKEEERSKMTGLTAADKEWRYKRVRQFLQAKGLKAMLVCGEARREANIRYFTGQYHRIGLGVNYVLFPAEGQPILFAGSPEREFNLVTYQVSLADHWVKDARLLCMDNIVKAFAELNLTGGPIGLTLDYISANDYFQLGKPLPQIDIIDITKDYERLRRVKSGGEIDLARESARQVDLAWEKLVREMKPGMYEHEATALLETVMWNLNSDKTFNQCRCLKKDVSRPTWSSTHAPVMLQEGDLFLAEIVSSYGGYYTQKVSLFSFGQPDPVAQSLFDASESAHQKAVELIRPGANAKDIVAAVDKTIRDAGFLSNSQFPTGPHGHLMGLDPDEGTFLPGQDFILETGMIMAIHPAAAIPDWAPGEYGVFGPGSTYLVTDTGVQSLNKTPNHFVII